MKKQIILITSIIISSFFSSCSPVKSETAETSLSSTDDTGSGTTTPLTNIVPIVNAGIDKSLTLPTNSITLNGTATDSDGTIASTTWAKTSGGTATLSGQTTKNLSLTNLVAGTYVFRFSAADNSGAVVTDSITITVNPAVVAPPSNVPPIVAAGVDKILTLPANSITLNGTATDSDGTIASTTWDKTSGGTATLSGQTTKNLSLTNLVAGTYVFRFSATDNSGAVVSDTVTVTVNPAVVVTPPTGGAGTISLWTRRGTVYPTNYDHNCAVFLPKDYGTIPTKKYRLIISLHGLGGSVLNAANTEVGGNKEGFIKQVWGTALADTFPAVVVAPNYAFPETGQGWWQPLTVKRLILDSIAKYNIDPKQVVITGLSAGGYGTNVVVRDSMDLLAGAMPIAFSANDLPSACNVSKFPLWSFGNEPDGTFAAQTWKTFQSNVTACPGYANKFKLEISPTGGHGGWDTIYARSDVQTWLLSQTQP